MTKFDNIKTRVHRWMNTHKHNGTVGTFFDPVCYWYDITKTGRYFIDELDSEIVLTESDEAEIYEAITDWYTENNYNLGVIW